MYNLDKNNIPFVLKQLFVKNSTLHRYHTRQANDYHLPKTRTVFASKTIFSNGPKYWNSLDKKLKLTPNLIRFKYLLKKHLIDSY